MKLTTYSVASLLAVALLFTACDKKNANTPKAPKKEDTTKTTNTPPAKPEDKTPENKNEETNKQPEGNNNKPEGGNNEGDNNQTPSNGNKGNDQNNKPKKGENGNTSTGNNDVDVQGDEPSPIPTPPTTDPKPKTEGEENTTNKDFPEEVVKRLIGKTFVVSQVKLTGLNGFEFDDKFPEYKNIQPTSDDLKNSLLSKAWVNVEDYAKLKKPYSKEFMFTDKTKVSVTESSADSANSYPCSFQTEEDKSITLTITKSSGAEKYSVEIRDSGISIKTKFDESVDITYKLKEKTTEAEE